MKKTCLTAMLLALSLLASCASANSWGLPGQLMDLFEHNRAYADYTMGACDAATGKNRPGDVAVFAMNSRYHNELFIARKVDGRYQIDAQSTAALRQNGWDERALSIALLDERHIELRYPEETYRYAYVNEYEGWVLDYAHFADTGFTLRGDADGYPYTAEQDGEREIWYPANALHLAPKNACGHLRSSPVAIDALPRTMAQLRRMQHTASLLPLGEYTEELYTGLADATLPVYSAPDEDAVRFAKGKASVGLKGDVLVLDWRDDFIMLMYDVSVRTSRIGYVQEHRAITGQLEADGWRENDFQYVGRWGKMPATIAQDAPLTDDPYVSCYAQMTLPAGAQVTALSEWNALYAVVETQQDGKPVRGFVPLWALDIEEPQEDEAAMAQLEHTMWAFYAGGSMHADLMAYLPDGQYAADWYEDDLGEDMTRTGRYSVAKYDPAWGLYWADVPYMMTYTDGDDGDVHRYGLKFGADTLSLYTEEGSGGFVPYEDGDWGGEQALLDAAKLRAVP